MDDTRRDPTLAADSTNTTHTTRESTTGSKAEALAASLADFEARYQRRPRPDSERGVVSLIVVRVGDGAHEVLEQGRLTTAGGLDGDRWSSDEDPQRDCQITLMMRGVAETVADGKPLHLPGDNFLVNIELSAANVPAGTRIKIGGALLEVTEEPHSGCATFSERFGSPALRWINKDRARCLRGINCRVVEDGLVSSGDAVVVVR